MIHFRFFKDSFKADMVTIWNTLKPKRFIVTYDIRQKVMYSCHWLWFVFGFERDVNKTKYKDIKETTSNG